MTYCEEWPAYAPSQILPGLFQGGTEDHHVLGGIVPADHHRGDRPFDLVVTLYADAMPAPWGVEEIRFGFWDAHLEDDSVSTVLRIARTAHARWAAGDRVLVRCQAGLNRSGLITALILMCAGYGSGEAIALLRERRSPLALFNKHFERFLRLEADQLLESSSAPAGER